MQKFSSYIVKLKGEERLQGSVCSMNVFRKFLNWCYAQTEICTVGTAINTVLLLKFFCCGTVQSDLFVAVEVLTGMVAIAGKNGVGLAAVD